MTEWVAYATLYVMDTVTREAASQLGVSQRQVQRLAHSGRIVSRDVAGRKVISQKSIVAASRSMERGRRWDERTVAAAAELLDGGTTERVTGSQRSRLRARMRTVSAAELAYHALGERVTLWRRVGQASAFSESAADGFTATGQGLQIRVVRNAAATARRERLLEDTDGDILLVELHTDAPAVIEDIALYAYGDTRTSGAAQQRVEARRSALA